MSTYSLLAFLPRSAPPHLAVTEMTAMTATRTDDGTEAALAALAIDAVIEMIAIADVGEVAETTMTIDAHLDAIDHAAAAQLGSLVEALDTTGSRKMIL